MEEAISDAFVGLWKSRDKVLIKNGKGLKIYLYGIARKTALDKTGRLARGRERLKKQLLQRGIKTA